jgi:hypothetical protein
MVCSDAGRVIPAPPNVKLELPAPGVRPGETVATVGFPNPGLQGFSPKLTKGEISSLAGSQDDPKHFQISLPVQPGNSGGALVDARGNVVGVVVAKLSQRAALATTGTLAENVNYAVKSSFLLSFLESVPGLSERLPEPRTAPRPFEEVVGEAEKATVLVLVYLARRDCREQAQQGLVRRLFQNCPPALVGAGVRGLWRAAWGLRNEPPHVGPYSGGLAGSPLGIITRVACAFCACLRSSPCRRVAGRGEDGPSLTWYRAAIIWPGDRHVRLCGNRTHLSRGTLAEAAAGHSEHGAAQTRILAPGAADG